MPKVLRIINRFNLGGPTYNVAYLTKYLSPDYETLLIGGDKEDSEGSSTFILEQMGIKPIIIPELKREINWKNDQAAYKKIKQIIKEFKPDIVHTHASKAGALGRLAANKMKVPVVVHTFHGHVFHSYFGKIKTSFYLNTERWLAKKSDAVIAISETQKIELVETYRICKGEKVKVVPLGFDLSRFEQNKEEKRKEFRKKYLVEEEEKVISIIGRLAPVKNHVFFVEVINQLLKTHTSGIRVFIIGDGETKSLIENKLNEYSISFTNFWEKPVKATVTFTSWIKDVDYPLAGSDLICLTSDNEGTPVSLIEAQAAGKPVVSTNIGGVKDIIEEGFALLSERGDSESMAENISFFINKKNSDERLLENESYKFIQKFSYHRLVKDMNELYSVLLKKAPN